MLLMDDLRTFPLELIAKDLFYRNHGLAGELCITHIKRFDEDDKTRGGTVSGAGEF